MAKDPGDERSARFEQVMLHMLELTVKRIPETKPAPYPLRPVLRSRVPE
jgi:hypothetical protein